MYSFAIIENATYIDLCRKTISYLVLDLFAFGKKLT